MAKETRKLRRAQSTVGKEKKKKQLNAPPTVSKPAEMPDPLGPEAMKALGMRLGLPLAAVWLVCGLIAGVVQSATTRVVMIVIPSVLTVVVGGLVFWALRHAKKAKGVAGIVRGVESAEDRARAIEELDKNYKKKDPTAIFARAQLEMQEDPKQALATLEQIDLGKVMANVADEARSQRAMIHLMLGQVSPARELVDAIDLSRQQDAKARAMMGAVVSEAWARSGQGKKALETVELFSVDDEEFEQVRPQLLRARAYAFAHTNKPKPMKRAMRKLLEVDPRLLGGFLTKKSHPLLQREAKRMLERSGQVPRKMVVQRR